VVEANGGVPAGPLRKREEPEKRFRIVKRTRKWFDAESGIFNQQF